MQGLERISPAVSKGEKMRLYKRKEIEKLFENVIMDLKKNSYNRGNKMIIVGSKKIGLIRYFLSIRLDMMEEEK